MGKSDEQLNQPTNPSLSYTLDNLESFVELELYSGKRDIWEPLDLPGGKPFNLNRIAQQRFIQHLAWLKQQLNDDHYFIVRSCNNFPASSGLASSASSFAALTQCAVNAITDLQQRSPLSVDEVAQLSRVGSGSSIRSFYKPWALWDGEHAQSIELPYHDLHHCCVIISHDEKAVSSSEAHRRVLTSPLFEGRQQRARERLKALREDLANQEWVGAYQICFEEFEDLHQLFATSAEPFHYITDASRAVLTKIQQFWEHNQDGPLVTMDAGPNIHLLFRSDQKRMAEVMKRGILVDHDVI